jgi:hypothetical protein
MGDAMNDDFLTRFQERPQAEFTENLYKKISLTAKNTPKLITARRLGASFGILAAVLVLAFMFVPGVHADVESFIRKIAGINFDETAQSPITCNPLVDCKFEQVLRVTSLEEAQLAVPFVIKLPVWTPQGYWQNPRVSLSRFQEKYDLIQIEWIKVGFSSIDHDEYEQQMTLRIWQQDENIDTPWAVAPESVKEVAVNGKPAALIHGAWNLFGESWNGDGATVIMWNDNNMWYEIFAAFHDPSTAVSDEDLLRMAESIP